MYKILLSNLGYARGIGGELLHHIKYAHRHFYCSPAVQQKNLKLLRETILREDPDICCLIEIDRGSVTSAGFNQLEALLDEKYAFFDIENKYAPGSRLRNFFLTRGKSNAFMAKRTYPHKKLYFRHGHKKLVYRMQLENGLTLFFAHFSLNKKVREMQMIEARALLDEAGKDAIFMGDFNILSGLAELDPLLKNAPFILLNRADEPTFTFHKNRLLLDLCIATPGVAGRAKLQIIPQSYSDHAALLLEIGT